MGRALVAMRVTGRAHQGGPAIARMLHLRPGLRARLPAGLGGACRTRPLPTVAAPIFQIAKGDAADRHMLSSKISLRRIF